MESFLVSALKYRPTSFDEVVGQDSITKTLGNSLKTNQLPQALLFCGPRGVGKTSCARILAKQINTNNSDTSKDFAFNIFELDAASNNSVEDIRKINEQVRIPPQIGSHKIYIIDEAHMLSNAAFNAFLKTLEEPPKHAIFILATTEKNKIISTVLSRCQVYDFKRISVEDIQSFLVKIAKERKLEFEENAFYLIAQKAEGALRDALSIFDRMVSFTKGNLSESAVADNLNLLDHQTYFELGELLFQRKIPQILISYDKLVKRGIESIQLIKGLGDHFRNLVFAKDPKTAALIEVGESIRKSYTEITQTLSNDYLMDGIEIINSCEINFRNVKNKRIHIELTLMQLASLHFNEEKKKGYIITPNENDRLVINSDLSSSFSVPHSKNSLNKNKKSRLAIEKENQETLIEKAQDDKKIISNISDKDLDFPKSKNIDLKTPVSGFSLSSIALKKAVSNINSSKEKDIDKPRHDFEFNTLESLWKEYILNLKKKGKKNIASIFGVSSINLKGANEISLTVPSEMNKVEMMKEMDNLLPFLRKRLNNYGIKVEILISEATKEELVYSVNEKYKYLKKLNPSLKELRDRFDLDF